MTMMKRTTNTLVRAHLVRLAAPITASLLALSGCDAKPAPGKAESAKAAPAVDCKANPQDASCKGEDGDKAKPDPKGKVGKAAATPNGGPKASDLEPAKDCCFYCFEGTPCGNKCVAEGETCAESAQTCACPASDRVAPKFKKHDRALKGLIGSDVWAFNKAQGDPVGGPFTLEMAFEGAPELDRKSVV